MDGEEINLEDDDDDSIMGRNFEHRPHLQPAQNYRQDRPEQVSICCSTSSFQKNVHNNV